MLIIGRVTADAVVKQLEDKREVVSFSVAVNDWYKPKGGGEPVRTATFFNCSWWISTGAAKILKKGALLELNGRVSAKAYTDDKGKPKASLDFHVSSFNLHQSPKNEVTDTAAAAATPVYASSNDDLPF